MGRLDWTPCAFERRSVSTDWTMVLSEATEAAIAAIEAQVSADVGEDNVGAISLGVVGPGGQLLRWRAFGWARKGFGGAEWVPNRDSDMTFRIGSISKSITVVGLMKLVEDKVLALDDPAELLVPEVKEIKGYSDRKPFTLKMLASHTSGLAREPNMLEPTAPGLTRELNTGHPDGWEAKALEGIKTAAWAFEPVSGHLTPSCIFYSACCTR